MAPPISDAAVVDVLRRIDRLTSPLVRRLARGTGVPEERRDHWWADQLPVVSAAVSATPRFIGKLADLLPLQNTVGAAVQCLVVLGVATEHGITDPAERVALLARVVLRRELSADQVRPLLQPAKGTYLDTALGRTHRPAGPLRTLWRVSRLLGRIDDTLDSRPKGKLRHRALANLPVVGVVGGYAAEREALRRAARMAAADAADTADATSAGGPSVATG